MFPYCEGMVFFCLCTCSEMSLFLSGALLSGVSSGFQYGLSFYVHL